MAEAGVYCRDVRERSQRQTHLEECHDPEPCEVREEGKGEWRERAEHAADRAKVQ